MKTLFDNIVMLIITVILIIGFYQFYFWCQRNHRVAPREFKSKLDNMVSFNANWVWIYSVLYYPVIVLMILIFKDFRHFGFVVFDFFILMLFHMYFFVFHPITTPKSWREYTSHNQTLSVRFLRYLQGFDKASNCFPSMHVSVATLTSCHLLENLSILGNWVWLFPILIAISAVKTKQHYVYDVIPGAILGFIAYWIFGLIY